jgi:hypothetical protein
MPLQQKPTQGKSRHEERRQVTVWHYTTAQSLLKIVETGSILPATAFVAKEERPIVWFSLNQSWEPTANKLYLQGDGTIIALNREQTEELGGGLVRIGVAPETAPYDWHALKQLSGMSSKIAQALYEGAVQGGATPGEWRGTFEPVLQAQWTAVEVFRDGDWINFWRALAALKVAAARPKYLN